MRIFGESIDNIFFRIKKLSALEAHVKHTILQNQFLNGQMDVNEFQGKTQEINGMRKKEIKTNR